MQQNCVEYSLYDVYYRFIWFFYFMLENDLNFMVELIFSILKSSHLNTIYK